MKKGILNVYRASAGSGKTFQLAIEYIKLLIDDPTRYRHILAVTFTNKATAEMKTRILSQLYGISHSLPDSEPYVTSLMQKGNWSETQIRQNCLQALQFMMHDYGRFSITTIDSFFQTILRQLIQELDLPSNLRVELDSQGILHEAVDQLMDDMTHEPDLLHSVLDFVETKMDNNQHWNVVSDLNKFGQNIFAEQYLEHGQTLREQLAEKSTFTQYRQHIHTLKDRLWTDLNQTANEFFIVCESFGINEDILSKTAPNMFAFFRGLQHRQVTADLTRPVINNRAESGAAWLNKSKQEEWADIVQQHLVPLLRHVLDVLTSPTLNTISVVLHNLHQLSLLSDIDQRVRRLNESANRFLLADTAKVLSQLIAGSDVPFIYERTGARIDYIMIDEMQDTSRMQWRNFKPLILNSLSAGYNCLLVGDIKQSIYRWRNGDWAILNNLDKDPDFNHLISNIKGKTNFRSEAQIVHFNNLFFREAEQQVARLVHVGQEDVHKAYQHLEQKIPSHKQNNGYVRIELLTDKKTIEEHIPQEIARTWLAVKNLLAHGINQDDIAILVRTNKYTPRLIQYFQEQQGNTPIQVVSNEAFQLDASAALRLLVQGIRVAAHPDDTFQQAILSHMLNSSDPLPTPPHPNSTPTLPPCLRSPHVLPLRELCATLYRELGINHMEGQEAYLFYFFDQLSIFISDFGSDYEQFLKFWDEKLHLQTIPSNGLHGLRILSIHKAKGLEYKSVIVPFCEWDMDADQRTFLWCEPDQQPFNEIPLLPITYGKEAKASLFQTYTHDEQMRSYVDNLNLLYVAFTRAIENLIVIGAMPSKNAETSIFNTLQNVLNSSPLAYLHPSSQDNLDIYETGEIRPLASHHTHTENVLLQQPQMLPITCQYIPTHLTFKQSNESTHFVHQTTIPSPTETSTSLRRQYLNEGLLFHSLLASVRTLQDIEPALLRFDTQGLLADTHTREHITTLLHQAFNNEQARDWFHPRWLTINEQNILHKTPDGQIHYLRPDRVITDGTHTLVIDYKTGQPNPEHARQVQAYKNLLLQMGYTHVEGYLWYVRENRIIPC